MLCEYKHSPGPLSAAMTVPGRYGKTFFQRSKLQHAKLHQNFRFMQVARARFRYNGHSRAQKITEVMVMAHQIRSRIWSCLSDFLSKLRSSVQEARFSGLKVDLTFFRIVSPQSGLNVLQNWAPYMWFVAASKAFLSLERTVLKANSLSRDVLL